MLIKILAAGACRAWRRIPTASSAHHGEGTCNGDELCESASGKRPYKQVKGKVAPLSERTGKVIACGRVDKKVNFKLTCKFQSLSFDYILTL